MNEQSKPILIFSWLANDKRCGWTRNTAWGHFFHDPKQWLNTPLCVWKSKKLNDLHETLFF